MADQKDRVAGYPVVPDAPTLDSSPTATGPIRSRARKVTDGVPGPIARFSPDSDPTLTPSQAGLPLGKTADPLSPDTPTLGPNEIPTIASAGVLVPGASFGRFRLEGLLGRGGMGDVWRAHDPKLGRGLALKFIRADNPDLLGRFVQEARVQARVEHPNICRVYEAGEISGRPYIAMQLVRGPTLDAAAREMSLTEKIEVFSKAVEGVHEAHRKGLIHRDLKPGNILAERTADGSWNPAVMDFGLARDLESAGNTVSGSVLGTPAYMPPEQVRGDLASVDRRSDVYSLGATLYELLSGRPPFVGSAAELLVKVLQENPQPLRKINPKVPQDLDAIVMKCIEKQPGDRYDTAKALREDLGRFLRGEPTVAAKPTLLKRGFAWGKRRWPLVAGAAVILSVALVKSPVALLAAGVLILALATVALFLRHRDTRRQAETAGRLGQLAEKIEAALRVSRMMPPHRIGDERGLVSAELEEVEARIASGGRAAEGPGHYALGRALLALDRPEEARDQLEQAWERCGFRRAEAALSLGRAYAELYRKALTEAAEAPETELRRMMRAEAERRYRDKAIASLRQGRGTPGEVPEYLEALLAFLDGRHEEAVTQARAAGAKQPWLYEAWRLEGEVDADRAARASDAGHYEESLGLCQKSLQALARAVAIAASDQRNLVAMLQVAGLSLQVMALGGEGAASQFETSVTGLRDTAVKLEILQGQGPWSAIYLVALTRAMSVAASDEPRWLELARLAEGVARELQTVPRDVHQLEALGLYFLQLGGKTSELGGFSPLQDLLSAVQLFEEATLLSPDGAPLWRMLSQARIVAAFEHLRRGGDDAEELFLGAIQASERAIGLRPDWWWAFAGLAQAQSYYAEYLRTSGKNASSATELAVKAGREAARLNRRSFVAMEALGDACCAMAQSCETSELSAGDYYLESVEAYVAAAAMKGNSAVVVGNLALVRILHARFLKATGYPSQESFAQALDAVTKHTALAPHSQTGWNNLGWCHMEIAAASSTPEERRQEIEEAVRAYKRALDCEGGSWYPQCGMGEALVRCAEGEVARGVDPSGSLEEAKSFLQTAMSAAPGYAEIPRLLGECSLVRGRWEHRTGGDSVPALRQAREWLSKAIEADQRDAAAHRVAAEIMRFRALVDVDRGGDPSRHIERGIVLADQSFALSRLEAEALCVKAGLLLVRALAASDETAGSKAAREGIAALNIAFSANRNLVQRFADLETELREYAHDREKI